MYDTCIAHPIPSSFNWSFKFRQISFILFSQTKLWLYRIFAALLAVPAALMWALVFSLITVVYVWILAPALRLFELLAAVGRRVFVGVMRCTVEPICSAVGAVLSLRPKKKTRKKKILCNDLISHITYIPYFIYLTQQVKRKHRFKEQSHYNFQPDIDF